ncbi:MAG TPA: MarR family transcriptional regulator [Candidatus Limihabitans stercoravium]|nr:MarR family transcriptional regulator [Candidatus Limihabitans stercoravium]
MKQQGGFLISKIKTIGGRKFDKILQSKNIDAFNGAQGKILYVLWEFGSMTATEISRRTGLAKTTLTTMLSRMCDQQLITFKESSSDKRSAIISLTPKVNEMKEQYDTVTEEMENIYYNGFTDEEVQQFEGYLRRILSNLEVEDE